MFVYYRPKSQNYDLPAHECKDSDSKVAGYEVPALGHTVPNSPLPLGVSVLFFPFNE